jgi:hypothetical protein
MADMVASVPLETSRTCCTGSTPGDDLLGERDLALTGRTEGGAARDGVVDGGDHVGLGVPEDHGPPGADEVDVLAPVGVRQIGTVAGHHEPGRAAHGAEGAHRGVHAARRDDRRTVEKSLRDGRVVGIRQGVRRPARPSAGRSAWRSAWRFGHDLRLLQLLGLLGRGFSEFPMFFGLLQPYSVFFGFLRASSGFSVFLGSGDSVTSSG